MSCTNPCLLQVVNLNKKQQNIVYRSFLENHGFKFSEDKLKAYRFAINNSKIIPLESCDQWQNYELLELPCGSCLSCRIDYARDWAVRCTFEAQLYKHNYFLTLSYDDDNVPIGKTGNYSLSKEHISEFIKALRNYFAHRGHTGIRYLLCGEYNSSGNRMLNPHYHLILFNCPIPDLTIDFPTPEGGIIHKLNGNEMPMFYSKLIDSIWSKGFVAIDDANFNTESYVSRYIMKKQKGESSSVYSESYMVEPPFLRMSNRPGIGFNFFLQNKDFLSKQDLLVIPSERSKPITSSLPKYFKRQLFKEDPSLRELALRKAVGKEYRKRTLRYHLRTSSNEQKEIRESHLQKLNEVFNREYE